MTNQVQKDLNRVSPLLSLLDFLGGKKDECLAAISLNEARKYAWAIAVNYANWSEAQRRQHFPALDQKCAEIGLMIISPPSKLFRIGIALIKWWEKKHPSKIIPRLRPFK